MSSIAVNALVALVVVGLLTVIWVMISEILYRPYFSLYPKLHQSIFEVGTQTDLPQAPISMPTYTLPNDMNPKTNTPNMNEVAMQAVMEWSRRVSTHSIADSGIGGSDLDESPPPSIASDRLSQDSPRIKTRRPSVSSTYSTFSSMALPGNVVNEAVEKARVLKERRELKRSMQALERAKQLKSMVETVETELEKIRKRRMEKFLVS